MLESLRHKTASLAQRGLAIDALHRKLDVALGRLEALEFAFASNVTAISQRMDRLADLSDNIDARARRSEDELRKLEEHFTRLNLVVKSLEQRFNERLAISEPWLPEEHFVHSEPEYYLAAFLHNFLPNRVLLDVGANVGDFTEVVSDSGYHVYAFEPFPATFGRLKARMADRGNVKTFNVALGSTETTLPLYVASEPSDARQDDPSLYNTFRPHFVRESLVFAETVDVPVRTIESMVKSGEVPEQIDFLKVDTEGFDLEVVRGLGNIRPSVVQTEFWGDDFLFVRDETNRENFASSAEIISELRNRDFFWNIIVFRMDAESFVRFGTNLASAPKKAWGNMLFFRDHNLFLEALRWCQGALPRFQALASGKFAAVQRD
jgi:FkbM family methyltransferase